MLEYVLRSLIMGSLASVAALCFERAAAHLNRAARFGWLFALMATTLLPLVPRFELRTPVAPLIDAVVMPAVLVTGNSAPAGAASWLLVVWVAGSCVVAGFLALSWLRLQQERKRWLVACVADTDVFVSRSFGPAVFGFVRPRIVLPEWVRTSSPEEQALVVLHEREHIRAKDQLLLLACMVAAVIVPWNPFVWLQTRKLRFTLETDCDRRVLAAVPEPERYARLLVDVGSRQTGLMLTAALAEHRNGLERRISMVVSRIIGSRWKGVMLLGAGLIVTAIACESRYPQEAASDRALVSQAEPQPVRVPDGSVTVPSEAESKKRVPFPREKMRGLEPLRVTVDTLRLAPGTLQTSSQPGFSPYDVRPELQNREEFARALLRNYPPLLRDAGIGGTVVTWVYVDEAGNVGDARVAKSSGHAALDEAAVRSADAFRFKPAENQGRKVAVWIQLPITFKAK